MSQPPPLLRAVVLLVALLAALFVMRDLWWPTDVRPTDGGPSPTQQTPGQGSPALDPKSGRSPREDAATRKAMAATKPDGTADAGGEAQELDPHLASIHGRVVDADGNAVPGAYVHIGAVKSFRTNRHMRADKDGTFAFDNVPPGSIDLRAREDRLGRAHRTIAVRAGTDTTCDLQLSPGLVLHGRVLLEDHTPVASASVTCSWSGEIRLRRTDELGRFAIHNCPEGLVNFRVEADGIHRLLQPDVDPRAGDLDLFVQSIGAANARLHGKVASPEGTPLAGLEVLAGRAGQSVLDQIRCTTAADGSFAFESIVAGRWYVSIATDRWPELGSGPHELGAGGDLDLGTLHLVHGGKLTVAIRTGNAQGVNFRARRVDGVSTPGVVRLDGDRTAASPLLPSGDYYLHIYGNRCAEQSIPFTITARATTQLDVDLAAGVCQEFAISVPSATERVSVDVSIHRSNQLVRRLAVRAVSATPRTKKVWLTAGSYTITATSGTRRGTAQFEVGDDPASVSRVSVVVR